MLWHPESEALSVVIIFRISTKQAALVSIWRRPTGAEQGEQAEQGNVFVHRSSGFFVLCIRLPSAALSVKWGAFPCNCTYYGVKPSSVPCFKLYPPGYLAHVQP